MTVNRQIPTLLSRFLALLLALAMASSLTLESFALTLEQPVGEAEQQTGQLEEATAPETPEQPADTGAAEQPAEPELPEAGAETPEPESPEAGAETPELPEGAEDAPVPPEDEPELPETEPSEPEEPQEPELPEEEPADACTFNVTGTAQLTLQYDDRYDFAERYEGYVIKSIQTDQVTSYQVSGGSKTTQYDTEVLRLDGTSGTEVVAAGVGTATVLLASENQEPERSGDEKPGNAETGQMDVLRIEVTVKPAKLTLMFLAGQSNMEGICSSSTGNKPQDSIACPEGQVYSTYLPKSSSHGWSIAQIPESSYTEEPKAVVAGSLTGTTGQNGETLNYPLDTLTAKGKGKTGPDSGLAYEWNRLTGDKVWVINAANSGSRVASWKLGSDIYHRSNAVFQAALQTCNAEVSAGHYTEGSRLMFWMQGEADRARSVSNYLTDFKSMHQSFADGLGVQYFGLITIRSSQGSYINSEDIYMNGPRIAQYYMGNSGSDDYSDVYVVSNVNEQWVSDSGVRSYFRSAYPGGSLTYPLRANTTLSGLPTTVQEIHSNIHYSQTGHNENGLTAARTMYYIVTGNGPKTDISVSWRDAQGKSIIQPLSLKSGESVTVVPVVEPLYRSKEVRYQTSSSALSYTVDGGMLAGNRAGNAELRALSADDAKLASLSVSVAKMPTPNLKGIDNRINGVRIVWDAVSGAAGYRVYRKTPGTGWTWIGTTTSVSYTDTSAVSGTDYTYTVRAYSSSTISDYDTLGRSISYLAPATVKLANSTTGVQVTWDKISEAEGYCVYRRTTGGSWSRLETIRDVNTLTYTDTSAVSSTGYEYTVTGYLKGCKSGYTGVPWVFLTTPSLTGAQNAETGVKVSWKKVAGATGYAVYRRSGSSSWSRIASVSDGSTVSYTDTTAVHGTAYTYTVRAVQGKYVSYYQTDGKTVTYLKTPAVNTLQNTEQGVKLTWSPLSGIGSYVVYRKSGSSGWTRLAEVTGTGYTDKDALNSGTTYIYTLRARKGDSMSGYHAAGYSILCLATPRITKAANTASGVCLTWEQVQGASGYVVYRKRAGDSNWTRLSTVTGTSYTDTNGLQSGTTYYYTLRAQKDETLSGYQSSGYADIWLSVPALSKAAAGSQGIQITWGKVAGAASYRIYRKTSGSGWTLLGTASGTSYTDTDVTSRAAYTYTVRACQGSYISDYDRTGLSATAK